MSQDVTLNASSTGSQSCVVTAAAKDNGVPIDSVFTFESSDPTVATVVDLTGASAHVTAVADPAGPSTRTATITATITSGVGVGQTGTGVATVVTQGDNVTITLDFSPPIP